MQKIYTKAELQQLADLELLNLRGENFSIENPLLDWTAKDLNEPALSLFRVMKDPSYIFFTCRHILNVKLLNYQQVIIQELWNSTFPMLIASRGAGKCVDGATWVMTNRGFTRMHKLVGDIAQPHEPVFKDGLFVLGENGFNEVEYCWNNGAGPTKKITTLLGYTLTQTPNHPIRIQRDGKIIWVEARSVKVGDNVVIDLNNHDWFDDYNDIDSSLATTFGFTVEQDNPNEEFPGLMLEASKSAMRAFLYAMFSKGGRDNTSRENIQYRSQSKDFIETLQFILTRFGILSRITLTYNRITQIKYYILNIDGLFLKRFQERIGCSWLKKIPNKGVLLGDYYFDTVISIKDGEGTTYDVHMKNDKDRSFVTNGFVSHNSFLLAVYAILRALLMPGRKVVITGAGFRQAKIIMNYVETIYHNAPILRSIVAENSQSGPHHDVDRWVMRLGDSTITALPIGDGQKIRGERAHDIVADEFASIRKDIFETVIAGFGVVELEPYEKVRRQAEIRVYKDLGLWTDEMEEREQNTKFGNQSIISGTAYYQFNHFADYWKRWHGIIASGGDRKKLAEHVGWEAAKDINWRDYKIIRLPVELLPTGYMDSRHVNRSKATVHSSTFLNEFCASFALDSDGFFKRSLIETCVTNHPVNVFGDDVQFSCAIRGNPNGRYIYGIDPASERDKFSIVVLEIHETHTRVVYCWTTDKKDHLKRLEAKVEDEHDFYGFCARKIRNLMKVFPCVHIAMDSQGGGIGVREALHDLSKLEDRELPIWEIKSSHPFSDGKERATDRQQGLHILELCNFAKAEYMTESNHGLKKDLEDQVLLFPMTNDTTTLAIEFERDQVAKREFDTYEQCFDEIEKLKNELSSIIVILTDTGRERFDTPDVKVAGSEKGRQRKDRYSALVMANYAARRMARKFEKPEHTNYGGFVGKIQKADNAHELPAYLNGPTHFTESNHYDHFKIIRRRGV